VSDYVWRGNRPADVAQAVALTAAGLTAAARRIIRATLRRSA
jgi:hypothetical protein